MIPRVVQAYAVRGHTVVVHFDDGKVVRWSARPLVDQGGVFQRLRDGDWFRERLTVLNGTVAWSEDFDERNCIDVDPLVLYEQGEDVTYRAE